MFFFFSPRSLAFPRRLDQGLLYLQVPRVGGGSSLHCTPPGDTTSVLMICLVILTTEALTLRIFHGKLASCPSKQTFRINTCSEVVLGPGQSAVCVPEFLSHDYAEGGREAMV